MHDVAMEAYDLEKLMNSSTESTVGHVKSLCPLDVEQAGSILDIYQEQNQENILKIDSPKACVPEVENITDGERKLYFL